MAKRVSSLEVVGSKSRGRVLVREKYLRDDIPCRSQLCSVCPKERPALLSSLPAPWGYLFPDAECILHFLEVFVSE